MTKRVTLVVALLFLVLGSGAVAQEASPSPEATGQRVEVPAVGIELTIPESWDYRIEMREMNIELSTAISPDARLLGLMDAWDPDGFPAPPPQGCSVLLLRSSLVPSGPLTPSDLATDPLAIWNSLETDRTISEVLLPAGPATRTDSFTPHQGGYGHSTTYLLVVPDGVAWLGCGGTDVPDDRWLSIAETIEFLPAEE